MFGRGFPLWTVHHHCRETFLVSHIFDLFFIQSCVKKCGKNCLINKEQRKVEKMYEKMWKAFN